jgi:ComF family protein
MLSKAILRIGFTLRPLYELIYPPTCLACESHLRNDERKICAACWSSIRTLTREDLLYQEKLAEITSRNCISGLASVFHFEKDGTLQNLIHQLKYQGMTGIGFELGKLVAKSLHPMVGDVSITAIVPVPLHPAKERERGFNQSEFICSGINCITGLPVIPHLLKRVRHTRTQTKLNAQERKANVADAFELNGRYASSVSRASFLLVDDIITTGATIVECARVLKDHGAEKIYAASIAVPDHTHLP